MLARLIENPHPNGIRRTLADSFYSRIRASANSTVDPRFLNPRFHAQRQLNRLCALGLVAADPDLPSYDPHKYRVSEYGYWTYMAHVYEN